MSERYHHRYYTYRVDFFSSSCFLYFELMLLLFFPHTLYFKCYTHFSCLIAVVVNLSCQFVEIWSDLREEILVLRNKIMLLISQACDILLHQFDQTMSRTLQLISSLQWLKTPSLNLWWYKSNSIYWKNTFLGSTIVSMSPFWAGEYKQLLSIQRQVFNLHDDPVNHFDIHHGVKAVEDTEKLIH